MASRLLLNDGTSLLLLNDGTSKLLLNTDSETGTDGVKAGEARAVTIQFNADERGEAGLASDSATQFVKVPQTGTDGAVTGDSASSALGVATIQVSGTDGTKASDDATQIIRTPQSGTDGAKASDSESSTLKHFDSATDGVKAGDSATVVLKLATSGTDGVKGSDSATSYTIPVNLSIISPATNFAIVNNHFVRSFIIELRDAGGHPVLTSGINVTVALDLGATGALNGTLVVPTDSNGRATFNDLSCTVAQSPKPLIFTAPSISGITDSSNFDIIAAPSDGVKASDSSTSTTTGAPVTYQVDGTDGVKESEATAVRVSFSLPPEMGLASDSATSRRISQTTDGVRAGDVATSRMNPWHLTATDGVKAADSADIGQRRVSASDGAKAGDSATTALGGGAGSTYQVSATDGVKIIESSAVATVFSQSVDVSKVGDAGGIALIATGPYDGARVSDSASTVLSGGGLQQTLTDGVKVGEARKVSVTFQMPTDSGRASDSATSNVRTGTIAVIASDGVKTSDSISASVKLTAVSDGKRASDDTQLVIVSTIPDEIVKASDSASSNVAGRIIDSGTDGAKASDTGVTRVIWKNTLSDGTRASDSASANIVGVFRDTGTDVVKASDAAGTVHTSQAVPFEGVKASDNATAQLAGAFVYHETGTDVGKVYDAAGPTIRATGPYDSVRVHEFATSSTRVAVSASDGIKASDVAFGGGETFAFDNTKAYDFAYANVVGGCVTAVTITYTCVSDPSVTSEVSCVTPVTVPFTEVE